MNSVDVMENSPSSPTNPWMVYILTFFVQFGLLIHGYDMGATSGAILLAQNIGYLRLTQVWKQLITAGSLPGAAVGSLIGSFLSNKLGRRKSLIIASSLSILGSIVSGSAFNRETLLVGRLLSGSGSGIESANVPIYIAECAPRRLRGRLSGVSQPIMSIGILLGTLVSTLFSYDKKDGWRYIWGFGGLSALTQFIAMFFLPESPRWFIQHSRKKEAKESLTRIRNSQDVEEELKEMEDHFKEVQDSIEQPGGGNLFVRILQTGSVRRALVVGCGLQCFAQLSGVNTIIYYSGTIIQMAGFGNVTNALWNSVIVNSVSLVFSIVGVWLVDTVGRRKLAIVGLIGLSFSSVCIAITFEMTARYSPSVNATGAFLNNSCSTYSQCNGCIRNSVCGFCYEDKPDVMDGACLTVSDTSYLVSELGACNSSLTLSKHCMKWAYDYCPVSFSWVAVIGLALFFVFYSVGMGPLPWTINGEIYPLWARSTCNGIAAMAAWICNIIIAGSFLSIIELIQSSGIFFVMASVALIGSIFCFFFLPETKNKSLEEIERLFSSNKPEI